MSVEFGAVETGEALEALSGAYEARRRGEVSRPAGWLVLDSNGLAASQLLTSFESRVGECGGAVVAGMWREGLLRPFGGLLDVVDDLVARVLPREPALLRRYARTLATLLPSWREAEPLQKAREIRSPLADFVLHGDRGGLDEYYRKRNLAPQVVADLIHFTLDASAVISEGTGAPTLLIFEDVHLADPSAADALRLLASHAHGAPVLVCAAARGLSQEKLARLCGSQDAPSVWQTLELEASTGDERDPLQFTGDRLTPEQLELVATASVPVLPFNTSAWLRLVPERLRAQAEGALEFFVGEGMLRRVAGERYAFAHARPRDLAYTGISPEHRRLLHREVLTAEISDPFAAVRHAEEAGLREQVRAYALQAMERAWGVSAYDCAIALAGRAFAPEGVQESEERPLPMALLHYEAGRYREAELFLSYALEAESYEGLDRTTLLRLLGYNAIFGLGDFARGKEILEEVLADYEARGREKDAGYVRNAIAYALLRSRKLDEAMELENLTFDLIRDSRRQDGFLLSLLQLNLARLHRTVGSSEQSLRLFRSGLETQNSDLSPYVLLIFHGSLAHVHIARGDYASAIGTYHHCLELLRDLDLENVNDQLLALLSRQAVAPLLADRLTRGDQVLCALSLNLALLYRKLGLDERASAHAAGLGHYVHSIGEGAGQCSQATQDDLAEAPATCGAESGGEWDGEAENDFSHLVGEAAGAGELSERVAESLEAGGAMALVWRRDVGAGVNLVDSLVVYDPREVALAQSVSAEVGAAGSTFARAALLLPEAVGLFSGVEPLPLVFQEATVKPQHREGLKALMPHRVRLQVLSPEFDGRIFEVLRAFARRTGVGVLAAVPFHLRGRDLAATPRKALGSFLISSLDRLALGDRLLSKTHGATAAENLSAFRPRLSQHASVVNGNGRAGAGDTFVIQVRTWSNPQYLRLRNELRPIIDLCDGRRSAAEVARASAETSLAVAGRERQVYGFLRELWRKGAICFDDPASQEPACDDNASELF